MGLSYPQSRVIPLFLLNAVPLWTNQTLMGGSSGLFPEVCFYHFSRGQCRGKRDEDHSAASHSANTIKPWTLDLYKDLLFSFFFHRPVDNSPVCRLSWFAWVCVLMSFTPSRRVWQLCNEWPQRLSLHVIIRLCGGGVFFCSSAPPPPPQEVGGGWRRAHNEKLDDAGRWRDWGGG